MPGKRWNVQSTWTILLSSLDPECRDVLFSCPGTPKSLLKWQVNCLIMPIVLLSAYCEMPERIMWLVDEYVLNCELPDGLFRVLEQKVRQPWFA
jgi:hypothetical protein